MNDILKTYQERFQHNRQRFRRYAALLLALAMITTLFVNWQLHGVGISMTADYQCGEQEHTHTADCYEKVLICGYEEGQPEDWTVTQPDPDTSIDDAFGVDPAGDSTSETVWVPHTHTEDCYTAVQTLTCTEEEHTHGDDCFDPEDGSLICEKSEHIHDESCYTTDYELTCGLEEGELVEEPSTDAALAQYAQPVANTPVAVDDTETETPVHHHTDACYEEVLVCPFPEHHHTVACLGDTHADLEDEETWLAATDTTLDGFWAEDLIRVAESQLDYEQSAKNFQLDIDDGVTVRHYTRYGQWYGNPYGEWDVMFLSYCLHYADIPQDAVPQRAGVLALRSDMRDMTWLRDADGSTAAPGDIVFYQKTATQTVAVSDTENSGSASYGIATLPADTTTAKPVAVDDTTLVPDSTEPQTTTQTVTLDTVGIVTAIDEDGTGLTVISGDVDGKVAQVHLDMADVQSVIYLTEAQIALSGQKDYTTLVDDVIYLDYFEETQDDQRGGITSTVVKVDGKEVTGNITLVDGKEIELNYKYYIPENVLDLANGKDTLTYRLPDGVVPSKSLTVELEDGVGTMTVNKDGIVTFKFNDTFDPHKPFTGTFDFKAKVTTEQIGDGGTITFPGDRTSITVNEPRDIGISKQGTYDESSGKRIIHYTVTVTSKDGWKKLVDIHDQLDNSGKVTGKYLKDTFTLTDKKGNPITGWEDKLTWDDSLPGFAITGLPEMNSGEKYILSYDVELSGQYDGNGSGSYHNISWLDESHKSDPWTWHGEYIKKDGKYNDEDGYMYWTVTLPNYNGGNLKGFVVDDILQSSGATIVGDVTVTEKDQNGQERTFDTISNTDGKTRFDYTFKTDATGQEYKFTYKTKVPDGATSVQNKSQVTTPDGSKYEADGSANVTDRKWSVSKSKDDGGSLTEVSSGLYKAPWKIDMVLPNSWDKYTYTVKDSIKAVTGDKADHYGLAKELQQAIEDSAVFTLVDGTTLTYAQAKSAGLELSIEYLDSDKNYAQAIDPTNGTDHVRVFNISLTKKQYTGANIKSLCIRYYTYLDVTALDPGETINVRNKADNSEAKYEYTKPKQQLSFEKGVSNSSAGYWNLGNYGDKVTIDYKENGTYLYYQLMLDVTGITPFTEDSTTVTDNLPAGLKYVDGSAFGAFLTTGNTAAYAIWQRDSNKWHDIFPYDFQSNPNEEFLETKADSYSSTDGQTLTFTLKHLTSLNENLSEFKAILIRYTVQVDPELWKSWNGGVENKDKDERVYHNTAHWGDQDSSADATVDRAVDNLDKDAEQLKDSHGNKTGNAGYTLKINPGAKDLVPNSDTVELVDTLTVQSGFSAELDMDSVALYDAADTTFSDPLPGTLYTFQYSTSVNASGQNVYTMTLTVPDQRALVLKYTYKTNAGVNQSVRLDNHAVLGGRWDADKNKTLQNIDIRGDISQSKLVVHKVDSLNQTYGLKDAKFALHWFNNTTGQWESSSKQHITSDDSGTFTVYLGDESLQVKSNVLYKLTEEVPPDGYRKSDKDYYFLWPTDEDQTDADAYAAALGSWAADADGSPLPAQSDVLICLFGAPSEMYISNDRSQLTIQKFWTNQYGEKLDPVEDEVTLKLYRYKIDGGSRDAAEFVQEITLTKAENWTYVYTEVEKGYRYFVEEVSTGTKYDVSYSDSNRDGVENGGLLTLTNKERAGSGYELPSTGGAGTTPFTAAGGMLMLAALGYGAFRKRRQEGRADD